MAMSDPEDVLGIEGLESPEVVGQGGFATVYKAFQPAFRRTVAVKVLAMTSLDDRSRERFDRECQAMGSISEHPAIVTVHDAGFTASGRPYLVMAYMPGGSLQDQLDQTGPQSWQDATLAGVGLAGALETAHRASIIHRDIKPANVLISQFGEPELTDFGIARISGGHETRSGVITASMSHAPPEILDGKAPTVGADIYSLASTIFELMLGKPAFSSETDESMVPMLRRILTEPPPDLRPAGVPDAMCTALERAMAKDPSERYGSAEEFGRALQAARQAEGLEPGRMVVARVPGQVVATDAPTGAPTGAVTLSKAGTAVLPPDPGVPTALSPVVPAPGAVVPPVVAAPTFAAPPTGDIPVVGPPEGEVTKSGRRGVLVAALVLVALLVIGGGAFALLSGGGNEQADDPDPSVSTTAPPADYDERVETNFVNACREGARERFNFADARDVCGCTFEKIRDEIPFRDFAALDKDPDPDSDIREQISTFSAECITELGLDES